MKAQRTFPQELFDALADDAIQDLCKTGLNHGEIFNILENSLGTQFAQRFDESFRSSTASANMGNMGPGLK